MSIFQIAALKDLVGIIDTNWPWYCLYNGKLVRIVDVDELMYHKTRVKLVYNMFLYNDSSENFADLVDANVIACQALEWFR